MRSIESELNDHASFLRAIARRLVIDDAAADDLVQDTFALALDRPPSRTEGALPWLITALRRRASTGRRTESRRARREREAAQPEATDDVSEMAAEIELGRRLLAHVEELAEPFRVALFLRYYEGLAPREIAARTGVPVATVKSRLARGLSELREKLDARGDGGRERWMPAATALGRVPVATAPIGMTLALRITLASAAVVTAFVGVRVFGPSEATGMVTTTGSTELAFSTGVSSPTALELERPEPSAARVAILAGRAATRDTIEVHGIVVDVGPAGKTGAADAPVFRGGQVSIRTDRPNVDRIRMGVGSGLGYGAATNTEQKPAAHTDAGGWFTVVLRRTARKEVAMTVRATATHRAAYTLVHVDPTETGPIEIELVRYPHGSLEGVVIDVGGRPIKDALVVRLDEEGTPVEQVETAIDGRFSFDHVRRERTARLLKITAPGRVDVGRLRTSMRAHGGWTPITVTLAQLGSLEVMVTNADGEASADTYVALGPGKGEMTPGMTLGAASGPLAATTDEHGRAIFDSVPAGLSLMLIAHHKARGAAYDRARGGIALPMNSGGTEEPDAGPIVVEAGQRLALTVVLHRDRVLSVTVVDASGQPVRNAGIGLSSDGSIDSTLGMVSAIQSTDSAGRRNVHLLGVDDFESLYLSASYTAQEDRQAFFAVTRVDASDPPEQRYTLVLHKCSPIEGTVVIPSDRVNWTTIKAVPIAPDTPRLSPWDDSLGVDAKGQIQGQLPHGRYTLTAEHPLHGSIAQTIEVPTSAPVEFVFTEEPDATVWIEIETGELDVETVQVLIGSYRPLDETRSTRFQALKSGHIALSSSRPTDAATRSIGWQKYDPGGVHTLRSSVLADWRTPTPIPIRSGPGWIGVQINDSNMRPYAANFTGIVNIPGGDTHLTFEAAPTFDVRCRLVGPESSPLRGAGLCIAVRDARGQRFSLTRRFKEGALRGWRATGYQGFFTLEAIPVGTYTLEVGTSAELQAGAPILVAPFTVEAEAHETLEFEVSVR